MADHNVGRLGGPRLRSNERRLYGAERRRAMPRVQDAPAAGAHAARHLINEDATPGAGALPSDAPCAGREVDGGAG